MAKQSDASMQPDVFSSEDVDKLRLLLVPGSYASVDISQTKAKGLSACVVTVGNDQVDIAYFHQPFSQTTELDDKGYIAALVDGWSEELISSKCILIDSPLRHSSKPGGRGVDQKAVWEPLGFGDYLNNEPQHCPTASEFQTAFQEAVETRNRELKSKRVTWAPTPFTWIQVGMALDTHLRCCRRKQTGEVYPTAALNALHLWRQAGLDITGWFATEPDEFTVLGVRGEPPASSSLRYLERIRLSSTQNHANRFRKLSYWEYPDLWDAFGGAVTAMLDEAGLAERVTFEEAPEEGEIIVPMRLMEVRKRITEVNARHQRQR